MSTEYYVGKTAGDEEILGRTFLICVLLTGNPGGPWIPGSPSVPLSPGKPCCPASPLGPEKRICRPWDASCSLAEVRLICARARDRCDSRNSVNACARQESLPFSLFIQPLRLPLPSFLHFSTSHFAPSDSPCREYLRRVYSASKEWLSPRDTRCLLSIQVSRIFKYTRVFSS